MSNEELQEKFKMISDAIVIIKNELIILRQSQTSVSTLVSRCNGLSHGENCCLKSYGSITN